LLRAVQGRIPEISRLDAAQLELVLPRTYTDTLDVLDTHAYAPSMPTELKPDPIGAEIRRVRDELGMTLQDFARHCAIPWQTLQAYETGRALPPSDRLLRIVHATRRATTPFRVDRVARAVAQAA